MQLIHQEFLHAYPLIQWQIGFFKCKQEPAQNVADYIAKLNSLGAKADLQHITMDDLYMLQLTVGLTDTCITEDLVSKQNFTKDQFSTMPSP